MSDILDKPKFLFPRSYRYYLVGQYILLGGALVVLGDLVLSLIIELVRVFQDDVTFSINDRIYSGLGIFATLLAATYLVHRHKERIRETVGNWAPLEFSNPVSVRTGVRDAGGEIRDCCFEAEMTLWFSSDETASDAAKIQGRIRDALKLFLEEASQDPVLRRSKNYFNDWINDTFQMPEMQKIEVRSLKFYPAPRTETE